MAYRVHSRLKSGGARDYIDDQTGEIISARQYRNILANQRGFTNLAQQQRATKRHITVSPHLGLVHHNYYLGKPRNLRDAIYNIIRPHYDYADSMQLECLYEISEDGYASERVTTGSSLHPALPMYIRQCIDEIRVQLALYGSKRVISYTLIIFPGKGAL